MVEVLTVKRLGTPDRKTDELLIRIGEGLRKWLGSEDYRVVVTNVAQIAETHLQMIDSRGFVGLVVSAEIPTRDEIGIAKYMGFVMQPQLTIRDRLGNQVYSANPENFSQFLNAYHLGRDLTKFKTTN